MWFWSFSKRVLCVSPGRSAFSATVNLTDWGSAWGTCLILCIIIKLLSTLTLCTNNISNFQSTLLSIFAIYYILPVVYKTRNYGSHITFLLCSTSVKSDSILYLAIINMWLRKTIIHLNPSRDMKLAFEFIHYRAINLDRSVFTCLLQLRFSSTITRRNLASDFCLIKRFRYQ